MRNTKNLQSFSPLALAVFEINETEIKTTFIRCSSGGFKFGQKYIRTRNVPAPKFTHSLLHLQTAKKSLILVDYRSLHVRKMKQL